MEITEKLIKPVTEAKYLNMENTDRYRAIIRLFYLQYEKLRYWLYQEEVWEELAGCDYFREYTMDQCQQDLKALTDWGNLLTMQDTRKVSTIEEFKNKKFRYQLSEYAVEIERLMIRLENSSIEGASLEPTLLEKIRKSLQETERIATQGGEEIYGWWTELNNDFVRLNQNYQDYMRELNSLKAEEMMKTKAFLVFKDRLVEYLRSFVKSLQINAGAIEQSIRHSQEETMELIFQNIVAYELSIPRLEVQVEEGQLLEKAEGRWRSLSDWFVDREGKGTEAAKVFDTTNEIIRKITRYATRISEQSNNGANRRREYQKVAQLFGGCRTVGEAHLLSALVFGVEAPIHLKGGFSRNTDSINSGVYEEPPFAVTVTPRVRNYREKSQKTAIREHTEEKEAVRARELLRIAQEQELLNGYIKDNCLDFATLPTITPAVRNVFLSWLSRALEHQSRIGKTEDGRSYALQPPEDGERCVVSCTDGAFTMPAYRILFQPEQGEGV